VANQKRPDGAEAEIIARLHAIREEVQKLRDDFRVPAKFSGTRLGRPAEPPAETREPEPPSPRPNPGRRARKKR
jgi:hypothetical protein